MSNNDNHSVAESVTSTGSSLPDSLHSSPHETSNLITHVTVQRSTTMESEGSVFTSPGTRGARPVVKNFRNYPSTHIFGSPRIRPLPPRQFLVRSVSEDVGINVQNSSRNPFSPQQKATSMIVGRTNHTEQRQNFGQPSHLSEARHSRTSSFSDIIAPYRSSSVVNEVMGGGGLLSRSSTRRSFGREWTRNHWEKLRDLEQESERARRCSKLSSGFAPLMVFGGLVFICIGVSATTNTGKDSEKLQKLSAAPMAMGIFMLALGIFLIASWFGCRGRARGLEQKLLHGSRRNSVVNNHNLMQSLIAKLYTNSRLNQRESSSPTLPGVTLDGVEVLKPQADCDLDNNLHRADGVHMNNGSPGCCSHCGAHNNATTAVLETLI